MIVKMSKVEIVGPKGLLQNALSMLQESGIFQIEPSTVGFIGKIDEGYIKSFLPDASSLSERLFLEDLSAKIEELFSYLPQIMVRTSYIEPLSIIDVIAKTIQGHIITCRDLYQKWDALQKDITELRRYTVFLSAIESILNGVEKAHDLDFIGLTIKDPDAVGHLRQMLPSLTDGRFELLTANAADGTIVGLITTEKGRAERVRNALSDEHIPELSFPSSISALTFPEKITYLKRRISEVSSEIEAIDRERERFARRWLPIYHRINGWINDRLSLLKATASVFETRMCFFIHGWMPSEDVERIRGKLTDAFGGSLVLEEKEILEEDIERVPVVLRNPAYFKPFELFVRLLPLPRYSSFDPTPFIGIFFPVFFGMILGDAGYGLMLIIVSSFMIRRFRGKRNIQDASKILLLSSIYTGFSARLPAPAEPILD